jgi:hypothetical protein
VVRDKLRLSLSDPIESFESLASLDMFVDVITLTNIVCENKRLMQKQSIILIFLILALNISCMDNTNKNLEFGKKAYDAWQKGEQTGNYEDFKKMLSPDFDLYSHPTMVRGVHKGADAHARMNELISGREKLPNNLTFSDPVFMAHDNQVAVQFNSEGKVMGQFPYKGYIQQRWDGNLVQRVLR